MTGRASFDQAWLAVADVEGWMTEGQGAALYAAAASCPAGGRIVEIGSFQARSTIVLALAAAPGVEIRIDESGEVFYRSPGTFEYYYKNPESTKSTKDPEGWVATGDAGFLYHIGDVETAARCGINTVTLVNNNSSGNQSKRGFDRVYGGEQTDEARKLWQFTDLNFARIAEEMGVVGIRVERPGEVAGAIQQAFEVAKNRPVILDVTSDLNALAPLAE